MSFTVDFFSLFDKLDLFFFFKKINILYLSCVLYVFSVKYEDPQALGSLASALDVRQQNTGGVSTLLLLV